MEVSAWRSMTTQGTRRSASNAAIVNPFSPPPTMMTAARSASLARRNLTPNDARALWSLQLDQGRPIGELAREWECDPSNATFIVDRLETAGLAARKPHPSDRRVKLVSLTR